MREHIDVGGQCYLKPVDVRRMGKDKFPAAMGLRGCRYGQTLIHWLGFPIPDPGYCKEFQYVCAVIPVLLGGGIPLLPARSQRTTLRLVSSKAYKATGTLALEYAVQQKPA